jgi:hypothetical protein
MKKFRLKRLQFASPGNHEGSAPCDYGLAFIGHVRFQQCCQTRKITITKNGDTESASCANSPGPALALCVRP